MTYYKLDHEVTYEDIKQINFPNQKIGVIIHIENENGEILLQQRGLKSRDENGLFEDIGGRVEDNDFNFKDAIIRELQEEAGEEVEIKISDSIGILHCPKNEINWIFIIYYGQYVSGKFNIMEPEKCLGYKFFNYEEAINSDKVSESCKCIIKNINKQEL